MLILLAWLFAALVFLSAMRQLRIQFERHFVLRPSRRLRTWPVHYANEITLTEVNFKNDVGDRLNAVIGRSTSGSPSANYWILFCHGNGANITDGFPWYSVIAEL